MSAIPDELVLWHALYGLEVRYWHDVDANAGGNAPSFYTADGVFAVGENEFRGREQIQQFYAWRGRRGMETVRSLRTTRHLISNFRVEASGERETKAFGVISFHEGSGRVPVPESNPPILIADLLNVCVLDGEDGWRFQAHRLRPVFMGADVPLSLAFDLTQTRADPRAG
jgi:SnoaL-like domain